MKKIIFLIAILAMVSPSFAGDFPSKKRNYSFIKKNDGGEKCFDENTHIINIGVGWGRRYYSFLGAPGYSSGTTPAFSLTYEQPWKQKLGPGYLGVGAYFGFQHAFYKYDYSYYNNLLQYNTYYYRHSWNYYMLAARAAYHWDVLNTKNAELYAGVIIGMRFQTHNYQTNDPGNKDPYSYRNSFAYPAYSFFAGARWYFAKNFGLFGEIGYGISYANGGFSIKF
jgi:hypothetical protein